MRSYSRYWQTTPAIHAEPQHDNARAVTVCRDFHPSVVLQFRFDSFRDRAGCDPTDKGSLLTVSFNSAF